MAYEYLNLIDGDLLTSEHIKHLEEGIANIENTANDMKNKLIAILRDKDIVVSEDESLSDILKKFTYLKNPDISSYEYSEDIIDIRETVQSGQIQMVSLDGSTVGFCITATEGFVVDWGDGSSNTYTSTSHTTATHTYSKGTGQYYDGTNTQFVITVIPSGEGRITRFSPYSVGSANQNQNRQVIAFAAKDIYFTNISQMFMYMYNIQYINIIGGSLGTSDLNTSMDSFVREDTVLKRISGNVCWNSITNMQYTFYNCKNLSELDLGTTWDTRNCTTFSQTFYNCENLEKIPEFKTNSTTNMDSTFLNCKLLETIQGDSWDLTNCTSLSSTFSSCTSLMTLPYLQNTNSVTNMSSLFYGCSSLVKLNDKQLKLECGSVTSANSMFNGCSSLEESPELNLISATSAYTLFYNCNNLYIVQEVLELPQVVGNAQTGYNDNNYSGLDGLFQNCSTLTNAPQIIAPLVKTAKNLFYGCSNLINIPDYISLPECIFAHNMFRDCSLLQTAPTTIELPKATYITYMFAGCSSLKVGPAPNDGDAFEFPEAIYANNIFYNCSSIQTPPVELKLPKATNISNIFSGCSSMTKAPDVIEIGAATDLSYMFSGCSSMANPPVKITAPKATSINYLFNGCTSLLVCPELDVPVCVNAKGVFAYCRALTSTIPYHFEKVTTIEEFYRGCNSLTYVEEVKTDANVLRIQYFLYDCPGLISIAFPVCVNGHPVWDNNGNNVPINLNQSTAALKYVTNAIDVYSNVWYLTSSILSSNYLEGTLTLSGLKNAITLDNKPYLTGFRLENVQTSMANLTVTNCALDEAAINHLFTDLPTVSTARTISIKGNPGASTCDTSIATAKNWTVVTV